MPGNPTKADYELARRVFHGGPPETRVNRAAVKIAAYRVASIAAARKKRKTKKCAPDP